MSVCVCVCMSGSSSLGQQDVNTKGCGGGGTSDEKNVN